VSLRNATATVHRMAPTFDDFAALDLRVMTVLRCEPNEGARDPAYRLWLDGGDLGEVQSSAKLTERYDPEDLIGKQVLAVNGFESLRVGGFRSDVLVLGVESDDGVVLITTEAPVDPGSSVT
jgi:tRNA-binding protein